MRSVVVAILLGAAACHGAKQAGPAWPAPSTTADDGGESIAPRDRTVAAAVEKSADDDDDKDAKPAADAAKPTAASEDKPATPAATPTAPAVDDVIITDDIIIEIED